MVQTSHSNAGGASSTSGQEAEIPHASWPKNQNIKQKPYCNKSGQDFKNDPLKKKIFGLPWWPCSALFLSSLQLIAVPWAAARQAPLSKGFSRQGHWSGLSFPSPGDHLTQGLNLCLLCLLHWQEDCLPLAPPGTEFNLWSGKMPQAKKQLSHHTATNEPMCCKYRRPRP